jgi:serine/threonine-protein kinase
VYALSGTLLAAPFDVEQLQLTGSPVPILEGVLTRSRAEFDLSRDGTLVYTPGPWGWLDRSLLWIDRQGQVLGDACEARYYEVPRISPDGDWVATTIRSPKEGKQEVWLCDLRRNTLTRLTQDSRDSAFPIWTREGDRVTYYASRDAPPDLTWTLADGTGSEERLLTKDNAQFPTSWSPDGSVLLFIDEDPETHYDIWVLPVGEGNKARPWQRTEFTESAAVFSPDGRWIAYQSNASGRHEIYVGSYPGPGAKHMVSTAGGTEPVWAADGHEIYYLAGNKMMAAGVTTAPDFTAGEPEVLFEAPTAVHDPVILANYDVTADGQQFLIIPQSNQRPTQINIAINWSTELARRVSKEN